MFTTFSRRGLAAQHTFFNYTSGRWLYHEKQQLKARFLPFNWRALKKIAGETVGANCVDITKHCEGMPTVELRVYSQSRQAMRVNCSNYDLTMARNQLPKFLLALLALVILQQPARSRPWTTPAASSICLFPKSFTG
ncbi:hypothetical protein B0H16DRAFT_1494227 [Mycena metata]|uniref:Uncharacterized protein n=1 Tax=Mycena metata TaxID=1033252 RepID=A0AAD7KC80_9AGAR|nr:hypothetical protein B0H16DRAFT_1494227 [Mycena metata]